MSIGVNLRVTGHTSIGGRKYQEDYFSVAYQQTENDQNLEYAYFGIYDGHGGAEASLFAKEHLMNTIVSQKQFWSENDEDVLKSIREGYIQTHYSMWREQDKWPKTSSGLPSTAGTTASIAFIRRGKIYIGHVGDSGIVLGYQKDKEAPHDDDSRWVASPLTEDHKPESYAEKMRIVSCGGKVVTKSGVPRVVWNRPRIGHKGPVRRSTPIDEIPFLAVARSLGDLWSYNSAMDEFIVSPVPDVSVIEIDPKKFRCLIFGTDGLWNVISPKSAVEIVRATEMENIRIALEGGNEWKNPSKLLVNEALERWSRSNMKADNTSVVIIMLDPPGPPKRDVLKSVKNSIQHASSDCRSAVSGATGTGSNMYDLYDCITRGDGGPVLPEMVVSRSGHSDAPSLRYLHHHHNHHHQHNYQHHRSYHQPVQQSVHHHHHHHVHHRDAAELYGSDPSQHLEHHDHPHHHHPEQYCHPGASTSYHHDLAYTDTSFAESYNSLLDRSFENTDHSYTTMFQPTTDDGTSCEESATSAYHNLATLVEANPTEDDEEALIDYLPESDDETTDGGVETMGGRRESTYSLTNLQTKSERLRAAMVESEGSHHTQPPYYHHHLQHRRGDEEEGEGCYSGGNLAIIEHFHNYHQHQYGGAAAVRPSIHAGPLEEHQSMYQMELTPQYHHQGGVNYQQNHFHHGSSSSSSLSQMERYDYRQPSTNNNLLGCEPQCGGSLSKEKPDHEFGCSSEYQDDDAIIQQPEEELDMGEQRLSGDVRHIQINEISSSYAAGTPSTVSIGLLSPSDSEGTASSGCTSGDEENNASSTTQQLVVVPVLASKRGRTLKKPPSSSARVITIFYETRSNSRRRPRICTAPSPSVGYGSSRSCLGVSKRRKTTTTPAMARSTITAPNPTVTLERRVLRSNGMNTTSTTTSGRALGASTGSRPMQTLVRASDPVHQPKLLVTNFGVSSTTIDAKPSSSHVCTRRTKLDERGTGKRKTHVATLVRTRYGGLALEHKPTANMGPRKAPANLHQQRTMLLRRTTQ